MWLNINEMLTFMVDCWKENVALQYDPKTRSTSNAAGGCASVPALAAAAACDVATLTGVETRIPGFGNTTNVEWIDKSMRSFSTYFALIVSKLLPEVRLLFKYLDYECSRKIFQGLRSRREHPRSSI